MGEFSAYVYGRKDHKILIPPLPHIICVKKTYYAATASRHSAWRCGISRRGIIKYDSGYRRPLFGALVCVLNFQNPFVITALLIRWPEDRMIFNFFVCLVLSPRCALFFCRQAAFLGWAVGMLEVKEPCL